MRFCSKCGLQNADSAIYCARCGSAVASGAGAGSPTVVVVGGNAGQQPRRSSKGTLWLWLNIVNTLLCCSIFSIIGIIFGALSISKYNNGLYNESLSNASTAKVMFIIGIIFGILVYAALLVYIVFMGGLAVITALLPFVGNLQ